MTQKNLFNPLQHGGSYLNQSDFFFIFEGLLMLVTLLYTLVKCFVF
jgi:hypothetical protein